MVDTNNKCGCIYCENRIKEFGHCSCIECAMPKPTNCQCTYCNPDRISIG